MSDVPSQASAPQHAARILILSYFVALALGQIDGVDLTRLLQPVMDRVNATYLIGGTVVALAALVLFDVWRRGAALVLALILFWSSYLTLLDAGDLAGFWRDLALIGALLLTAGVGRGSQNAHVRDDGKPIRHSHVQEIISVPQSHSEPPTSQEISQFREDFDIAREA